VVGTGVSKIPMVPHVLPLQLFTVGDVAIAGLPGEFTTMPGRRLIKTLTELLDVGDVILAGYANEYSQHITTYEEYQAQHYEGASTLFGPHTLDAYLDAFGKLAKSVRVMSGKSDLTGAEVVRTKTSASKLKRVALRNLCEGTVRFKIYDNHDKRRLSPRALSPVKMSGQGDLVYETNNRALKIKI